MNPGKYKHRITIESKVITKAPGYNTDVITWTPYATRIAAEVQDVLPSKSESTAQGMQQATRAARIRIRYRPPGITSAMRIVVHGATPRTMQIVAGPAEISNRTELEFMAQQYTTDPQAS